MKITIDYIKEKYKNKKFTLYHIKGKKWGCTSELKKRLKEQGYTIDDTEEIKEVIGIEYADKLEEQLNIKYGYSFNHTQSYINVIYKRALGGSIGGKISGPQVSKIQGQKNVENKFWEKLTFEQRQQGGLKNKKTGHIQKLGKLNGKKNGIKHLSKKIESYDFKTGKLYKVFNSMSEASREFNCSVASISYATQGKLKQVKGYKFKIQ